MNTQDERYPELTSDCRTPKIFWHQGLNTVSIRIMLTDVKDYHLKVTCDTLQFSTTLNGHKYFVGLKLCGTVIAEKTSHEKIGTSVKIRLIKALKWFDWPRLQLSREKNNFISIDPDHIIQETRGHLLADQGENESFEDYRKRMNITNIRPAGSSSSSGSESDDERLRGYD